MSSIFIKVFYLNKNGTLFFSNKDFKSNHAITLGFQYQAQDLPEE